VPIIIEGKDDTVGASVEVPLQAAAELPKNVIGPGEELADGGAHELDLSIAEDRVGREGGERGEGIGDLLLEAGDPGRVDGHFQGAAAAASPLGALDTEKNQ
jgi:hypothetical protein